MEGARLARYAPGSGYMTNQLHSKSPRAGQVSKFASGSQTYLSPLPLPTGLPPADHSRISAEIRDGYLELGAFTPNIFGWQLTFLAPMTMLLLMCLVLPILVFISGFIWGNGIEDAAETYILSFIEGLKFGGGIALLGLLMALAPRLHAYFKLRGVVPTRFNRQRREVCLVPSDSDVPVFVPWEDIQAWVIQAQGATQYGVQRQYGFGFGGVDPSTGTSTSLEMMSAGLPLAISTWEALRAYMEYEVNSLEDIQVSQELQKPRDPPWEGVHTFYNARERMHQRRKEGEVSRFYPFLWYCYHLITLWTLPNHLTEWEVRKVQRLNRRATPESMQLWSEPLPEAQWAKPSGELKRQSERVLELQKAYPGKSTLEIFAQVNKELDAEASMTA